MISTKVSSSQSKSRNEIIRRISLLPRSDVRSGKLGSVGGAVNLQNSQRADDQHEGQQQPVKITKRDHPPHQSAPEIGCALRQTWFRRWCCKSPELPESR